MVTEVMGEHWLGGKHSNIQEIEGSLPRIMIYCCPSLTATIKWTQIL